jgi:hypothetical protein
MKAIAAPVSAPMATKAAAIGKIVIGPPGQIVPARVAMTMPSKPDSAPTQRITVWRGINTATKGCDHAGCQHLGQNVDEEREIAEQNFQKPRLPIAPIDDDGRDGDSNRNGGG